MSLLGAFAGSASVAFLRFSVVLDTVALHLPYDIHTSDVDVPCPAVPEVGQFDPQGHTPEIAFASEVYRKGVEGNILRRLLQR